jgi:hypothetical protein
MLWPVRDQDLGGVSADAADRELDRQAAAEDESTEPTGGLDYIQAALHQEHHARLASPGKFPNLRRVWLSVWDSHRSLERELHSQLHST